MAGDGSDVLILLFPFQVIHSSGEQSMFGKKGLARGQVLPFWRSTA